ncbi:energy-coupling factor ABC transporter permease [Candidatus Poribacteria bacterium]|nr:energy-coupling factor ABC transporter permease [Candidatus Poribacteria bacterium]
MHMADALLSPTVGISFWVGTMAMISFCARKLKNEFNEKIIPLMGIMGAFIFAAQMINFTIPGTGSSGHIAGGLLLTIILGPWAGFITISSVIFIQALFFADGGLLALGCNIWNMGFYACFIAYPLIFKPIMKINNNKRIMIASIFGSIIALELGASSVIFETVLSKISELPFITFSSLMLPIHLLIAVVEGIITGTIIIYVKNIQPDIFYADINKSTAAYSNIKKVILSMGVLVLITGGILSWFASTHPDGLEWSIGKTTGKEEVSSKETSIHSFFSGIQEKTAILPDYGFKKNETEKMQEKDAKENWPAVSPGTSVSGIIGAIFTLGITILIGFVIKYFNRKKQTN